MPQRCSTQKRGIPGKIVLHLQYLILVQPSMFGDVALCETDVDQEKSSSGRDSLSQQSNSLADDLSEGTTLYDKKCILINHEIDSMGMGRYQWYLWSLCGCGYLVDLMWAQAFGLVLSPMQQELGFGADQTGALSTAFSVGLTAGALIWGVLVDVVGRRWAFNLTVLISSIFGLCIGAPSSFNAILILTALTGIGVGGNIPIDTTITLEFTPTSKRYLLPLLSIFQPLGVVICSVMAYGFIPNYSCSPNFSEGELALPSCNVVRTGEACCTKESNMGWRYLLFTLGAITLFVFFLRFVIFDFQESPKFLLYRGKDEEAVQVLQNVAKFNGRGCGLTLEKLEALERDFEASSDEVMLASAALQLSTTWTEKLKLEGNRFELLFSGAQMTRLTILVWLTYVFDYSGFTVAGTFLPQILALKNGALHLSLSFTYRSYILIYLPGTLGVALGTCAYRIPLLGRKYTMVLSSAMMGVTIFLLTAINSAASNIGFSTLEYFFQSMFNAVLYGWTPEAFPAPVRGTACGVASFWGRGAGIVMPLVAQRLYAGDVGGGRDVNAVLYLAGSVSLGCVITTLLLPGKLVGGRSM
ncbi:MFS general substrate transporter [Setomelanomma holmii]|uniref:MFS general substrate transporter n=1 Tax=Setomelanomma holmii TaxID=210430 RepID=A0A9P4LJJ5_9PLEO|nr:MFS general substrate transporter [Setomelanomma holmii]